MPRYSTVALISNDPESHGVYDNPIPEERTTYCEVRSVTRAESYDALSHGLHPEWTLVLSDYQEYQDEPTCRFEGHLYRILRTYTREDHHIELVIERMVDSV